MFQDEVDYLGFTWPQRGDKEIHLLEGLIKGITIDGKVTSDEAHALRAWCGRHAIVSEKHPFNEILPLIDATLADGVIDNEEREDLLWFCQRFTTPNEYFSSITSDMQRLHGMLAGIVADGVIETAELESLRTWINRHEHLKGSWPFDEIDSCFER